MRAPHSLANHCCFRYVHVALSEACAVLFVHCTVLRPFLAMVCAVRFRAVIFRPFIGEVITGKIRRCSPEGVHG